MAGQTVGYQSADEIKAYCKQLGGMTLMMDKLKSIKIDVTLAAVLSVVLGVLLVIWPGNR